MDMKLTKFGRILSLRSWSRLCILWGWDAWVRGTGNGSPTVAICCRWQLDVYWGGVKAGCLCWASSECSREGCSPLDVVLLFIMNWKKLSIHNNSVYPISPLFSCHCHRQLQILWSNYYLWALGEFVITLKGQRQRKGIHSILLQDKFEKWMNQMMLCSNLSFVLSGTAKSRHQYGEALWGRGLCSLRVPESLTDIYPGIWENVQTYNIRLYLKSSSLFRYLCLINLKSTSSFPGQGREL